MNLKISQYSRIENKELWLNDALLFKSDEEKVGKVFKSIYKFLELKYPKYHKMDKLCKLGFLSSEALLKNFKISETYSEDEVAVVLANSNSTINIDSEYYDSIKDKDNYFPSPALFVYTLPNIVVGEIAIRNTFRGEIGFLVQEKFDSNAILSYVKNLFETQNTKACITGWVDIDEKNQYKTVLFLVEKAENSKDNITFDKENLEYIFNR
jgi:hypothetical protein